MLLYHYSKNRYDRLETRRLTQSHTPSELKEISYWTDQFNRIGDYIDHISFFFDPIPSKLLPNIFPSDHATWFKRNDLYEYVIDTDDLEHPFAYDIVETPKEQQILDSTEWIPDSLEFTTKYIRDQEERKRKNGEVGTDLSTFLKQIRLYKGKTKDFYVKAARRGDRKHNEYKYASGVPHVMLYPNDGFVEFRTINRVTIGYDRRTEVFKKRTLPKDVRVEAVTTEARSSSLSWMDW